MNITAINTDRLAISTPEIEQRRATMAADWFIRVHTPKWLDLAGLISQADLLRRMPEITDFKNCPTLMPTLIAIEADALAALDAAAAAAGDAAAAADAAADAAWFASRAAARAAAWDATAAKLQPTIDDLQSSAVDLVERMSAVQS